MFTSSGGHVLDRREFKYLVPDSKAREMAQSLRSVCSLDEFAGADKSYTIRSLYLDSDQLDLYWANEREQDERFKARIRSYPPSFGKAFVEIKARYGDSIRKTRCPLPIESWAEIVQNPTSHHLEQVGLAKKAVLERFLYFVQAKALQPNMLVEYDREAYFSLVDDYARVTFDRGVRSQEQTRWSLEAAPKQWRVVDHPVQTHSSQPMCVVELKFGAMVPRWMSALVQNFELIRYSFSKYCYSIDAHKILPRSHVAGVQARGW
ncbi:MAG: polyphosphate polymerase domain-containing protein [Myxococcota bacterium]|nr:polyphosphate polymerase domain-containing protein [Myxococcota bacterium]